DRPSVPISGPGIRLLRPPREKNRAAGRWLDWRLRTIVQSGLPVPGSVRSSSARAVRLPKPSDFGEERSAQLKVENSFRESMSPPGGQRSEKTAGGQSRDRSAARLRGYGVSNPFLDPIPWPRGATQLTSSSPPVGGTPCTSLCS